MNVKKKPWIVGNFPTKNGRAIDVASDNLRRIVLEHLEYLVVYVKFIMVEI